MKKVWVIFLIIFAGILLLCNMCLLAGSSTTIVADTGNKSVTLTDNYQGTFLDVLQNDGLSLENLYVQRAGDLSVCKVADLFNDTGDSVLMICRTSLMHCEKCVDYAIEKALELIRNKECNIKMVLFGCYENVNSLKILQQSHPMLDLFDIYLTPSVIMPIDEHGYPYYFTLNKSLIVQDVFVPDSKEPVKTDIYWKCISGKWEAFQLIN